MNVFGDHKSFAQTGRQVDRSGSNDISNMLIAEPPDRSAGYADATGIAGIGSGRVTGIAGACKGLRVNPLVPVLVGWASLSDDFRAMVAAV